MTDFSTDDQLSNEKVVERLKSIAESGQVKIDWAELSSALKFRLTNVLDCYMERNNDCKEGQYEEPNVEKFHLESARDEILELISSFSEPPFTIQRICELLYSPFKYYDKVDTFLRGLEKNLRVISSNDWPISQTSHNISCTSNNNNNNISSISDHIDCSSTSIDTTQSSSEVPSSDKSAVKSAEDSTAQEASIDDNPVEPSQTSEESSPKQDQTQDQIIT